MKKFIIAALTASILATELDMPIVPVALDGLQNVWARKSWKIRPAKVKITIGKPFYAKDVLANSGDLSNDERYALVTDHLKQTIADMIDQMRGERKTD